MKIKEQEKEVKNMNDNKLFFYNILARLQILIGIIMVIVSICCIIATSNGWWIGVVIFLGLAINGFRMRFKFKRQAGHILFRG